MNDLTILRKFAEYQQYSELTEACEALWLEGYNPEILPLWALGHAHLGQLPQARKKLAQVESHKAALNTPAQVDMAAVLMVLQQVDEAAELLNSALEQQPDYALGLARLGVCLMLQGDLASAQTRLQQAADIEPERTAIFNHLAAVHLQQSEPLIAQQVLDRAWQMLEEIRPDLPNFAHQQQQHLTRAVQLQAWVANEQFSQTEHWLQEQEEPLEEEAFVGWLLQYGQLLAERDLHTQAVDILRQYSKNYPDNVALCLRLAELAQLQGQFMLAVNLLQRAIRKDEANIALWVQLSSACLHSFEKKARHAAEKAVELALPLPEDNEQPQLKMQRAQARNALAQVESHEQNFEQAEALFRDILAEHKNFIPALQGLGQQQMQQGNIDEALTLFERIKQLDPIKGHSALINARHFPDDVETLEKMAKVAQAPSQEGSVRAGILFQLAAAWEKRGEYDKAFEFAQQANLASKKFLPYDGKEHRDQCARIRVAFCTPLYQHRADCGNDSRVPVYVLGMPRSGTTLVEQIIAGHSQIFGAGELGIIPQTVQGLNRWERHVGSGRSYPDCVDDITAEVAEGISKNILKELQEYAPEASHIVDKLPHNFENIGLIKLLFPQAKIISVRRDPRDIAISNYFTDYQAKHGGMGFAYDLTDTGEQLADHNMMMHHWSQVFPNEILEVNYEDVVDDLEGSARKMLDYIGVGWEPQVLKFNELERAVKTASVWQVRQPIYKTSKAKWRRYEKYLQPLIKGTNAPLNPVPTDMLTLPEAGFLTHGVALYRNDDLDAAELNFKKMLHHNPQHAACNYMVGLVYLHKNHFQEGIVFIEKALEKAPWHKEWRENLAKAYELTDEDEKLAELQAKFPFKKTTENEGWSDESVLAEL